MRDDSGFTATIYAARAGAALSGGGSSTAGHMWYSTSNGSTTQSFGFYPETTSLSALYGTPGKIVNDDLATYQEFVVWEIPITEEQYNKSVSV